MPSLETLLRPHPRVLVPRSGPVDPEGNCIVYWMQRSQRGADNAALNLAIAMGNALRKPVLAAFGLTADYPGAQRRHYRFLVDALPEIRDQLGSRGVPFLVRLGDPSEVILGLAREVRPAMVVGDENPLRVGLAWRDRVAEGLAVPLHLVDADVIVPTSHFPNEEYAARTLRPKIRALWPTYLKPIPNPKAEIPWPDGTIPRGEAIDPDALLESLRVGGVAEVPGYRGGPAEASRRIARFLKERLPKYDTDRNEPTPYMTSELSAHLHFGHVGPLTIALAVRESGEAPGAIDAYLEELIVRRELTINFVSRNPAYDKLSGSPDWALKTLEKHAGDPRPVLYDARTLEAGETHDPLWNAAQKEMVLTGRMHNYLRMYWAKKILEWSPDAESAFGITVDQNDRFEMDGRDPTGYANIAWAIGGRHDRPWPERPIFGTVRFMSFESTRKKFDSSGYIRWVDQLERGKVSKD